MAFLATLQSPLRNASLPALKAFEIALNTDFLEALRARVLLTFPFWPFLALKAFWLMVHHQAMHAASTFGRAAVCQHHHARLDHTVANAAAALADVRRTAQNLPEERRERCIHLWRILDLFWAQLLVNVLQRLGDEVLRAVGVDGRFGLDKDLGEARDVPGDVDS